LCYYLIIYNGKGRKEDIVKAIDFMNGVLERSPWVDRENTVDKIIDGRPDKELGKLLVVWRCGPEAVDAAIRGGYDGIVTHEPTYYFHMNEVIQLAAMPGDSPKKKYAEAKQRLIRGNDLTVIRIHDSWDSREKIGIAASWAKSLGLTNLAYRSEPMQCECRYDIPPTTAGDLLETVREAVKGYQAQTPFLFGDRGKAVSRVGVGAGCIGDIERYMNMGCDIAIVCDDGVSYWGDLAFALDCGFPVIRVSHAASEEAGIQALSGWIKNEFGIETEYMREAPVAY